MSMSLLDVPVSALVCVRAFVCARLCSVLCVYAYHLSVYLYLSLSLSLSLTLYDCVCVCVCVCEERTGGFHIF